jgi:Tol biopolymer transport system component/predicted Ser/Thr protein kinase
MDVTAGTNLGPYEIVGAIGAGGMGEVYKARDTRLNRTVAIKVLPKDVAADPERKQRFEREAQAIAALNHPNICVVYDVGQESGVYYIVMEYLEGETLASRLEKGPMPLQEALKCAIEIGDAIDKAHERHVVHRDLKPANIMMTKSSAKLLDFGLAKFEPAVVSTGASQLPTNLTMQGTVLGTPQYMSPEQVEGLEPDARTDIFALGIVLYEMLTGAKAFKGKSHASLMASILEHQPQAMTAIQQSIPLALERIVERCIRKAPEDRWQNARDLVFQLKWMAEGGPAVPTSTPVAAESAPQSKARELVAWSLAVLAVFALGVVVWRSSRVVPVEAPAVEFSIAPPQDAAFAPVGAPIAPLPAISPDGRYVAFVASKSGGVPRIWIRALGSSDAREIAGTDGGFLPFWSPDSRQIGFLAGGEIKRIDREGGSPLTIVKNAVDAGATWGRDGTILFMPRTGGISRVSAAGGEPVQVTKVAEKEAHLFPHFLPDGEHFLYRHVPSGNIYLASLSGGPAKDLFNSASEARYAAPGYLLFSREGTLLAQSFDVGSLQLSGEPFRVADNVRTNGAGYAAFSVSDNGTLVYRAGAQVELKAAFFDRSGRQLDPINQTGDNRWPRLSPDDSSVVVQRQERDKSDIWIIDAVRGTNSRLTFNPTSEVFPIWSPDGSRIAYGSYQNGKSDLYWKLASGLGTEELLFKSDQDKSPLDFSPDGKFLLFRNDDPKTGIDLWVLSMDDKKAKQFLQTQFAENGGRFSPDGKWVAYFATESGMSQIYVQPFPPTGARWQVSVDGGVSVGWGRNKKELFFVARDNRLMVADYSGTTEFKAGIPKPLFQIPALPPNTGGLRFSVARDDERFLFPVSGSTGEFPLTVLLNWTSAFKK